MKSTNKINTSLKKSLEREFFHITFENIKKHEVIEKLHLTDEEILHNRYEIQQAIESWQECGSSKVFCTSLNLHYHLKRNQDNQLILVAYKCKKQKDYKSFSEEKLNKKIKEALKDSNVCFSVKEAIQTIDNCSASSRIPEIIQKKGIGKAEFPIKNLFFEEDQSNKRHIIYLFHAILINMGVIAIKSEQLKKAYLNKFFSKEQESKKNLIDKIKNIPILVIIDFGIEGSGGNNYYYFDIIPELLEYRNSQEKVTCIFSPIKLEIIFKNIQKNNFYKNDSDIKEVQEARWKALNATFQKVFNSQET